MADLTDYVIGQGGPWVERFGSVAYLKNRLMLAWNGDFVQLQGELRVRITFYADNITEGPDKELRPHPHKVYSYVLHIPAGHTWSYTMHEGGVLDGRLGTNAGYDLVIEPAGAEIPTEMIAPSGTDIPCHVGVANIPNLGAFFPSICEPCPPGASVGLPPGTTPTLAAPAAKGGCMRPRFFNGMFITSEDMETLLRWTRLKQQMQNRAMGQGVVWGLNVDRDGHHIRVHPGYAVDCCGHDLVVTTPYCVDIGALLRDPAARPGLEGQGPHRMHLLLEYVECPEEPRPVHGDPCSPQVNRCEMSRIRETVRLRLVPPRDYEPDGPIDRFLKQVEALTSDPTVAAFLLELGLGPHEAAPVCTETTEPPAEVPYTIGIRVSTEEVTGSCTIEPSTITDRTCTASGSVDDLNIRIRITATSGWALVAGSVRDLAHNTTIAHIDIQAREFEWQVPFSQFAISEISETASIGTGAFSVDHLRVAGLSTAAGTMQILSSPQIELTAGRYSSGHFTALHVEARVAPVTLVMETPAAIPQPCFSEACATDGAPLFPVMPPWLHEDPLRSGQPAEPRVLTLAVIYALLTSESARQQAGAPAQPMSARLQAAWRVYRFFAAAFYGVNSGRPLTQLSEALRQLLCAWCQSFLYPGPQCEGEPHGVVVGCATVDSGNIVHLNAWGGRRYVMHYPLIAHWSERMGITPPDILVSRVMTLVCCVAGLEVPVQPGMQQAASGTGHLTAHLAGTGTVPVGDSLLQFRSTSEAAEPVLEAPILRCETISHTELLNRMVNSLTGPSSARPAAGYVRYELSGAPQVVFFVPQSGGTPQPTAEITGRDLLIRRVTKFAEESSTEVSPLLDDFANELTVNMLDTVSLEVARESPVGGRLLGARILSIGRLLRHSAVDIDERICESVDAHAVVAVLDANNKTAAAITKIIRGVMSRFSAEHDVISFRELASAERMKDFKSTLVEAINKSEIASIPAEIVGAMVDTTVNRLIRGRG